LKLNKYWPELHAKLVRYCKKRLKGYPNPDYLAKIITNRVLEQFENQEIEGETILRLTYEGQIYVDKIAARVQLIEKAKAIASAYHLLVIVGAGFSFEAELPLSEHLEILLKQIGAKDFGELEADINKENSFKKLFKNLSDQAKITEGVKVIINKFKNMKIYEIISLNWDNIIERAYGNKIPKICREEQTPVDNDNDGVFHYLWKFHGDVEDLEYKWIYPSKNSKGRVFKSFLSYIDNLITSHPICVMIIGYSEHDDNIRENVIEILNKRLYVLRIGFDFNLLSKYDDYIFAPSEWAILNIFGSA
jgi:hypothetical protein